jgi:hypothetical protein
MHREAIGPSCMGPIASLWLGHLGLYLSQACAPHDTACDPRQVLASDAGEKATVSDFLGDAGAVASSLGALSLAA